mmetsp:Transcript_71082/g.125685  ORF Transcript_71082/g.125685 Transcript_71082/m.125685 type:complete len:297 (+) Transcript_71082:401-1291(+)
MSTAVFGGAVTAFKTVSNDPFAAAVSSCRAILSRMSSMSTAASLLFVEVASKAASKEPSARDAASCEDTFSFISLVCEADGFCAVLAARARSREPSESAVSSCFAIFARMASTSAKLPSFSACVDVDCMPSIGACIAMSSAESKVPLALAAKMSPRSFSRGSISCGSRVTSSMASCPCFDFKASPPVACLVRTLLLVFFCGGSSIFCFKASPPVCCLAMTPLEILTSLVASPACSSSSGKTSLTCPVCCLAICLLNATLFVLDELSSDLWMPFFPPSASAASFFFSSTVLRSFLPR